MATRTIDSPLIDIGLLIGRIMLALIFVMSGWGKLMGLSGFEQNLTNMGVPQPHIMAIVGAAVEFGGGALIILGLGTRIVALIMLVFVCVATYLAHQYWTYPPDQQMMQYINFWKNVAIAGGYITLAAAGAGRISVDGARQN